MGELVDLFLAGLAIYFLYKLVVDLIMPVTRVATNMRSKIKEMQQEQFRAQSAANKTTYQTKATTPAPDSEYIDFEEVK